MKEQLKELVLQAIDVLREKGTLPADMAAPAFVIERTRSRDHGDFATNAAMLLAKPAGMKPREVAEALIAGFPADAMQALRLESAEIAGPGFINFRLGAGVASLVLGRIFAEGDAYGRSKTGAGRRAGVEFVSANPTGPLHVGHGRAAAIGDCLARLLDATGWDVVTEFYYNDAGVQIANLAVSTQARARGITPDDSGWPEAGYRGDYIADVARAFLDRESVEADGHVVTGSGDVNDLDGIRRDRKSTRLNSSHLSVSRMPSSA